MASTKLAFMAAVAVLLLQASWCAVARARHHHHLEVSPQGGTPAVMTVNSFERGGDGEGPSDCDGRYRHSNRDLITALSTGWYAGGKRCHKKIRITSVQNGRTVEATVVDECDSRHGCKTNIVDTSKAVWKKLGLNTEIGEVPVIWSDA